MSFKSEGIKLAGRAEDEQWVDDRSVDGNGIYHERWAEWLREAIEYGRTHPRED